MPRRTWPERVRDIVGAAERIREVTHGLDYDAFVADQSKRQGLLNHETE